MAQIKIQSGQTLFGLAKQYGTTTQDLLKLNPQISNPNLIYSGAMLTIPEIQPTPPTSTTPTIATGNVPTNVSGASTTSPSTTGTISPSNVDLSKVGISTTSDIIGGIPKTYQDIQSLINHQEQLRQQYLQSLQPTQQVTDLQTQIADIQNKIKQSQTGLQAEKLRLQQTGMEFGKTGATVRGQQALIEQQAQIEQQTMAVDEGNLLTRLGLAQQAQQAQQHILETGMSYIGQDIKLQQDIQDRLIAEQDRILQRASIMSSLQKSTLAQLTDAYSHKDFSQLSPEIQQSILNQGASVGIAPDLVIATLANAKHEELFNEAIKKAQLQQAQEKIDISRQKASMTSMGASPELLDAIDSGMIDPNRVNSRTLNLFNSIAKSGLNAISAHASASAKTKSYEDMQRYSTVVTRVINVLDKNIPLVVSLADKVNTLGIPKLDAFVAGTSQYTGNNPDVVKYVNTLKTLRAEYAQMLSRGQAVTESERAEAADAIPAGLSGDTYQALADQLKLEGENIIKSANEVRDSIFTGKTDVSNVKQVSGVPDEASQIIQHNLDSGASLEEIRQGLKQIYGQDIGYQYLDKYMQ